MKLFFGYSDKHCTSLIGLFGLLVMVVACNIPHTDSQQNEVDEDSVRIKKIQLDYRDAIADDYSSSRDYLQLFLQEIDKISPKKPNLAWYFLCYTISDEMNVGNMHFFDSLSRIAYDTVFSLRIPKLYSIVNENRGIYYWRTQNLDSAIFHFQEAIKYAEQMNQTEGVIVDKLNLVSILYGRINTDSLINRYENIIDISNKHDYIRHSAAASNNLAILYADIGQLYNAIKCYQNAIKGFKELKDENALQQVYSNIAGVYTSLGMDSLAIEYNTNVIKLAHKYKNNRAVTNAMSNLAFQYASMGSMQMAIDTLESLVSAYNAGIYPIDEAYYSVVTNLGGFYLNQKNYKKAKLILLQAYKTCSEDKMYKSKVRAAQNLSYLYFKNQLIDSSLIYCDDELEFAIDKQMIKEVFQMASTRAKCYIAMGQYKRALEMYHIYEENIERHLDTIAKEKLKDVAYFYELQQKENEKKFLQQENKLQQLELKAQESKNKLQTIIIIFAIVTIALLIVVVFLVRFELVKKRRIAEILGDENDFKNSLFSVISHDLRSPIINMYNSFVLLKNHKISDDKKEKIEQELVTRSIKAIDLIDNLLYWTRPQFNGIESVPEEFDIHQLVNEVYESDLASKEVSEIHLVNKIDPNTIFYTDKGLVRLLIRNLLTNAFKFTPTEGEVSVSASKTSNEYVVWIKDTGVGMPADIQNNVLNFDNIQSVKGIHNEQGKGLGLSLCNYFLAKQGGRIWFESAEGKGTVFYFSLPNGESLT